MSCPHGSRDERACPDCADESNRIAPPRPAQAAPGCLHPAPVQMVAGTSIIVSEPLATDRAERVVRWCPGCGALAYGTLPPLIWRMPDG